LRQAVRQGANWLKCGLTELCALGRTGPTCAGSVIGREIVYERSRAKLHPFLHLINTENLQ
jgi:hypothetical protein